MEVSYHQKEILRKNTNELRATYLVWFRGSFILSLISIARNLDYESLGQDTGPEHRNDNL